MATSEETTSPLAGVETRLRNIIPAKLYADVWITPSVRNLTRVFNHLRTMHRILHGYLPRQIISSLPKPGAPHLEWVEGTLMFTDLAGFTPLLEKNAAYGKEGAQAILDIINGYFTEMLQIISKSGGNLLEFTGDALLAQFPTSQRQRDTSRAVRAGLRMQRAMKKYKKFEILGENFSLGMRVGIHPGRFLTADIGTPHRMEHVLLGSSVLKTKKAEGFGKMGLVNLSEDAKERVKDEFHYKNNAEGFSLVVDDLSEEELGDYDIITPKTRMASMVLFDTSKAGLVNAINDSIDKIEPLATFLPSRILNLIVENAASRGIPPDFPGATLLFINLLGLPENLEDVEPEDLESIIVEFSRMVSLFNAEIESQGGVMKKVTYHHAGPDIMAFFGVPEAHTNDTIRAISAANAIIEIVKIAKGIKIGEETIKLSAHIGITCGQVFAAEIGERQGRREFNVMGNTVNTAARLMDYADSNQIIVSEEVHEQVKDLFETTKFSGVQLKGKSQKMTLYAIGKHLE
ncbi:MAG: adenylate/guanylate cyclase domain-containing protein [Anaerolineales bacterium]|jgi:class 3 adenylate cyclase